MPCFDHPSASIVSTFVSDGEVGRRGCRLLLDPLDDLAHRGHVVSFFGEFGTDGSKYPGLDGFHFMGRNLFGEYLIFVPVFFQPGDQAFLVDFLAWFRLVDRERGDFLAVWEFDHERLGSGEFVDLE